MEAESALDGGVAAGGVGLDPDVLHRELAAFTGTTTYYRHTSGMLFTEGVHHLAQRAKAYWLVDLIVSWQPTALRDPWLREFQLWELSVREDRSAVVICFRDSEDEAFRQEIAATDFPLNYVRLYVEGGVMLLPSEH
jgi:hypothetical protein